MRSPASRDEAPILPHRVPRCDLFCEADHRGEAGHLILSISIFGRKASYNWSNLAVGEVGLHEKAKRASRHAREILTQNGYRSKKKINCNLGRA